MVLVSIAAQSENPNNPPISLDNLRHLW